MATSGVEGAVASHGADLFVWGDLIRKVRQDRAVTVTAGGELHSPDITRGRVHRQMDLAVLAPAVRAVLARQPLSIAQNLIPVLSTSRFSGPDARRPDIWTAKVFCLRLSVEKSGTGQSGPAIFRMLATMPVLCRSGRPKSIFNMRQNWIAASENTGGRPGRPALVASHAMSLSSQISSEPRCFKAAL